MSDDRARAVRAILGAQEASCDVRDEGWGTFVVNPEFHRVYVANYLSLRALPPGGLDEALRRMEETFAPLRIDHRQVFVEDPALGDRLRPELEAQGFEDHPSHVMVGRRAPSLAANPDVVLRPARDQATRDDYDGVEGLIHEEAGFDHEESHQLLGIHWRRLAELDSEAYVAYLGGEPAGCATIADLGGLGVVEEVATVPAMRGRGVGATMMLHLLGRARSRRLDPLVLETPLRDTTVGMYERLGFDRTGTLAEFLRAPRRPTPGSTRAASPR